MKRVKWIGVAFLLLFSFGLFVKIEGLSSDAMWVIGIFISGLVLWITQGIEWPTLFVLCALGLVPTLGMNTVIQSAFGNAVFAFLLFTFMCTHALSTTPFMRKVAYGMMNLNIAKKGPKYLLVLLLGSVLLIGLFVSPTVLFFMVYPIFEEIVDVMGLKKGDSFAEALMIGLIMVVSLSSGMTPIGHVFPVLALSVYESMTSLAISYAQYMAFAIPFGLILFGVIILVLVRMFDMKHAAVQALKHQDKTPMTRRDTLIVSIFFGVVVLWIAPSLTKDILPEFTKIVNGLGTAFPPLLGILLMSFIQVEGKPLVKVAETLTKGVPWVSLVMAGATLALGAALTHNDIGIMAALQQNVGPMIASWPTFAFVAIFVVWTLLQSNVSSHMVTAQVVSAVAVPLAMVNPHFSAPAIVSVIALLASVGSSTPSSMPYVAVVGSSGWSNTQSIVKVGVVIMVIFAILSIIIGYPFAQWMVS